MERMEGSSTEGQLPKELQHTVQSLDDSITAISKHVESFLKAPMEDIVSNLTSEEHAKLNVLIAYALNTLFYAYLKTQGAAPSEHPVKDELVRTHFVSMSGDSQQQERVKGYIQKLRDLSKPKEAPNMMLNKEAADRFIQHALSNAGDKKTPEAEEKKRKKKNSGSSEPTTPSTKEGKKGKKKKKKSKDKQIDKLKSPKKKSRS